MKYMVFGFPIDGEQPDELLGTSTHTSVVDNEPRIWEVVEDVTLPDNLMRGKTFPMTVVYTKVTDKSRPAKVVAYYEIPGTD